MKNWNLKRLSIAIVQIILLCSCTDDSKMKIDRNINSEKNKGVDGTNFKINKDDLQFLKNQASLGDLESNEKLLSYYYFKRDKLRSEIHLRRLYEGGHHVGLSTMGQRINHRAFLLDDSDPTKLCELLVAEGLIKRSRLIKGIDTKFPGDMARDNKIEQLRKIHPNVGNCQKR